MELLISLEAWAAEIKKNSKMKIAILENIHLGFYSYTGVPHGVVANVLNIGIVVSEFKLQSCHYVHFLTNTLGKGMNSLIAQLWVSALKLST